MGLFSKKPIAEFDADVWGTAYCNENGTSRQSYIARLKVGQDLFVHPAPTPDYPDTIGVFTKKREQIGFVGYRDLNMIRGQYLHNKCSITVADIQKSDRGLLVKMHIKIYK